MKISSKFTVAVHTLLCIYRFKKEYKVTSDFIAGSTGVNPVIIRRTLISLKAAGLVNVAAGTGGAELAVKPEDFTLFDIYKASGSMEENIFGFHEQPNPACPVGGNIHNILDSHLADAQKAFEQSLVTVKVSASLQLFRSKVCAQKYNADNLPGSNCGFLKFQSMSESSSCFRHLSRFRRTTNFS